MSPPSFNSVKHALEFYRRHTKQIDRVEGKTIYIRQSDQDTDWSNEIERLLCNAEDLLESRGYQFEIMAPIHVPAPPVMQSYLRHDDTYVNWTKAVADVSSRPQGAKSVIAYDSIPGPGDTLISFDPESCEYDDGWRTPSRMPSSRLPD